MPEDADNPELAMASQLVARYGWNATSCQILNPGIDHWFAPSGTGVVGYTRRYRSLLVAGAPVCPSESLSRMCREFEAWATRQGFRVCYVCAEERLRKLTSGGAYSFVTLGAQPVWDPRKWPDLVRVRASLRAQLHRSRNKGLQIDAMASHDAAASPELRDVLRQWLAGRVLPPLHFLVEPNVLDGVMRDRVVLVGRMAGRAVAFLVASPIPARNGYLVELLARSLAAPNGASELLIDAAMRRFGSEKREYVSLGLVALASAAQAEIGRNPLWLRGMMTFARLHANRFYNFRGLEQFRAKMAPVRWEPVYAISNERRFSVRTLYSIGAAFSGIAPWRAIAIGLGNAVRQELGSRSTNSPGIPMRP